MPRLRRKRKVRDGMAPRTVERLLTGCDWPFLDGPALDADDLRDAWSQVGEEITADFIADHPGFRPAAYWRFEAADLQPRREDESEPAYLRRLGLLTEGEKAVERQLADRFAAGLDDSTVAAETGLLAREVADWRKAIEGGE